MATAVPFTISGVSAFSTTPVLTISWTGFTPDVGWNGWRVYRRAAGTLAWEMVFSTTTQSVRTFDDWTAPSVTGVEYAVTQTLNTGDESRIQTSGPLYPNNDKYWLVVPADPDLNFMFYSVQEDDYDDDVQVATVNLIGRGRRVEHGDNFGIEGKLRATLTDQPMMTARAQREMLVMLRMSIQNMYLRTPFGDVWAVHPTSMSISRIAGVGQREFCTVELDYTEVTA